MAEDNHTNPLAPAPIYGRSDEEFAPTTITPFKTKSSQPQTSSKLFVYALAGIVILCAILLVFSLVALRVKTPKLRLSEVLVKNLKHSPSSAGSPSLNATLIAQVTIENTNFGRFEFENSTMSVIYDGGVIGEDTIRTGRAKARDTKRVDVTIDVRSSRLADNYIKNLIRDINVGVLQLRSYAEMRGKVHVLSITKKKRTLVMNCTMELNFSMQRVQDLRCF